MDCLDNIGPLFSGALRIIQHNELSHRRRSPDLCRRVTPNPMFIFKQHVVPTSFVPIDEISGRIAFREA